MRIGIFGIGSIGSRHARNLYEMGERDVLGFDPRIGQPDFMPDILCQAISVINMVWDWKPEVVLVCTPPDEHYHVVAEAIAHGCHVFCEKPLCADSWDADCLTGQARDKHVQLAVGYQLRWQLKEFRDHAATNNLTFISCQNMATWASQYEKDILDEFSHEIDAAVFVNGPVEAVTAYRIGAGWRIQLRHLRGHSSVTLAADLETFLRIATSSNDVTWAFDQAKNDQAYRDELATFLKVCQGAPWDYRLCSGTEAAHVCKVIEACRQSADTCEVVRP